MPFILGAVSVLGVDLTKYYLVKNNVSAVFIVHLHKVFDRK